MRMVLVITLLGILASAVPPTTFAGAVLDTDSDLVPDQFDNCRTFANGPNQTTNQVDVDLDGYGNRCDADYDQNGATTINDFAILLGCFGQIGPFGGSSTHCRVVDHDGNDAISTADFGIYLGKFSSVGAANAPGPSDLLCADPTIRVDLGQTPCTP